MEVASQVCATCRRRAELLQPLPRAGELWQVCPTCFYVHSALEIWVQSGPVESQSLLISVEGEELASSTAQALYEILRANSDPLPAP